ncbi:ethanolamine utilization protein [Pseudothauera nasutitermitis]|uniref:DNA-directed DNA polymerase n=1 Tax=Pseudothauera nasutitermitis TaxID=2565930 RepID=A0A4S4APL8_9RHOO|nr:exonuclease domain-containing protein [Pseudothauera nasutitermitis]THF61102.1 ethanolamine utilization protein [Pseudothauera nasutitermitis]
MSLPERLAILDVETTGANPARDRVTEIAILRVERGEVVARWAALVNPGMHIPRMIQDLIGITDDMVADAPSFAELADQVRTLLDGCVFVAHNARFDYGFLRNEFARLGQSFEAPVLCTVKLSRALYPEHHRHGLDALIVRHGLQCDARHRALGDSEALWRFIGLVVDAFPAETLGKAAAKAMKAPPRPSGLPDGALEGMPTSPGVYLLYGEEDRLLYVGRAASLRARVMDHLGGAERGGKDAALARDARRIEWRETAGELSATLLEHELIGRLRPLHNRQSEGGEAFALRLLAGRKRPPVVQRVRLAGTDPTTWEDLYGVFRQRREADRLLREFAQLYGLCLRRLGLESGGGACQAVHVGRCAGVCTGRETPEAHDERLARALEVLKPRVWPWPGAVVVREHCEESGRAASHLIDRWCLLGSAQTSEQLESLLESPPAPSFDADLQRILQRWLADPVRAAAVVPVAAR